MTAVAEHTISSAVQGFLNGPKKLYIGGEFVDAASGQTFATYNPADGQKLADVAHGQAEDIDRAADRADMPAARVVIQVRNSVGGIEVIHRGAGRVRSDR